MDRAPSPGEAAIGLSLFPCYNPAMSADVTLRPARPEDAPQAAPLIYAAGPTLFNLMFGPSPPDVLRLFGRLFPVPRHPFSYDRALVAEQDGRIAGIALAASIAARRAGGWRLMWLLPRFRGVLPLLRRWPDLRDIGSCMSAPPQDVYYLGILAVTPEMRRRGVGSRLIEEVHRQAQATGAPGVALHAEADNLAALRFYARHGYIETERHLAPPRLARKSITGLVALRRTLP